MELLLFPFVKCSPSRMWSEKLESNTCFVSFLKRFFKNLSKYKRTSTMISIFYFFHKILNKVILLIFPSHVLQTWNCHAVQK